MRELFRCLLAFAIVQNVVVFNPSQNPNFLHVMLERIHNVRTGNEMMDSNYISDEYPDEFYNYNAINSSSPPLFIPADGPTENVYEPDLKNQIPVEDLIKIIFSKDKEPENMPDLSKPNVETESNDAQGYYYYYYPLKNGNINQDSQLPPELATVLKSMMPGKNMTMPMKPATKNTVGPLFSAMAWFVGTAMIFIVSILLMPRIRLVKIKSFPDPDELFFDDSAKFSRSYQ